MWSEPGPEPVKGRRYEEVTFCQTSQFVLIHSWTNGETLLQQTSLACGAGADPASEAAVGP